MKLWSKILSCSAVLIIGANVAPVSASGEDAELTPIEQLGEFIFFDEALSINKNQSCATCHDPAWGWTGPKSSINSAGAVYPGSIEELFGNRKPPTSAYATLSPIFYADFGNRLIGDNLAELADDPLFVGGNFWDGRATGWDLGNPAADQAQGPFLNPVEQALPDAACVVYRVCTGSYGHLFDEVWSPARCDITWPDNIDDQCSQTEDELVLLPGVRSKVDAAYDRVALSIAAFEASDVSNAFTSKLDAHRAGFYEFTPEEERGRQLFRGKGKCSKCHVGTPGPGAPPPLFTNFTYDNLGVPKNPLNPVYDTDPGFVDPGLEGFLKTTSYEPYADANLGKQKVPTLRNVAKKPGRSAVKAYMHNGFFKTLKGVVKFYNTAGFWPTCTEADGVENDIDAMAAKCWPAPEVPENVNREDLGDLDLTDAEEDDIVAFMEAMSDGFFDRDADDDGDDEDERPGRDRDD